MDPTWSKLTPSSSRPPEVCLGARLCFRIEDLAFGGEGVGRFENFVVFVPFVIPGEEVEVEVIELKKHFARAKLLSVKQAAPERVTPRCRYFGQCGGCQYQHIEYTAQLDLKHRQVASLFERLGGFPQELVQPLIPCPKPFGYRNRLMIRSQWDKFKQGLNIGFLRAQDRLVVDVEECAIAEPALNEQIRQVRAQPPPRGGLKVTLRIAPEGWSLPGDSFFQNNFFLLPELVRVVRDYLVQSGSRHLVDAYCGIGFFALELADLVESYLGVEIDRPAIQAARRNAAEKGRLNGKFILGATEEWLPELAEQVPAAATTILLDPPRRGCAPGCAELFHQIRPAQIIYVSCHPATLARDLKRICSDGVFELRQVTPLDMFPQTQHVECVADLRLATGSGVGQAGPPG